MTSASPGLDGLDAVVLVGHGSRSPAGRAEMTALTAAVTAAAGGPMVRLGYLELSDPPAVDVLEEVLESGARTVVVAPLMLHAAGHAKSDVPALVVEARARHPRARIEYGRPLGADHALLELARRRVASAGGLGAPVAVLARGSSDPDANAEAYRVSRLVADMSGANLVATGFSGVTWPDVPTALDQLRRLGADRIVAFAWYLCTGLLIERMKGDFGAFSESYGVEVIDAGYLGTGTEVTGLVVDRIHEAFDGRVTPNCDACAYRRPFPGLEDRVGQAIGLGHSHLAADHRHGRRHDHGHEHQPGPKGRPSSAT